MSCGRAGRHLLGRDTEYQGFYKPVPNLLHKFDLHALSIPLKHFLRTQAYQTTVVGWEVASAPVPALRQKDCSCESGE